MFDSQGNKIEENLNIPNNPEANEFRKSHWTIDAGINSGQVQAGDVDKEHLEFLKSTEFVKEEVKEDGK